MQESDREKLQLARQKHVIEEQKEEDSDFLKEKRKEERAAKRAARKEAAKLKLDEAEESVLIPSQDPPKLVSRSRVTVGSTAASR